MAKPTTVKVIPNPYAAIDADGVPQGVVGLAGSRRYIGARIDESLSARTGKTRFFYPRFPDPVELPLDGHIPNAIREGSLLVVTVEDARKVGIPEKNFLEPEKVIEDEREKALRKFQAHAGIDATIGEVPTRRQSELDDEAAVKAAEKGETVPEQPKTPAPNALRTLSGTPDQPHVVMSTTEQG